MQVLMNMITPPGIVICWSETLYSQSQSHLETDLDDPCEHRHLRELNRAEDLNPLREQLLDVTHQAVVYGAVTVAMATLTHITISGCYPSGCCLWCCNSRHGNVDTHNNIWMLPIRLLSMVL